MRAALIALFALAACTQPVAAPTPEPSPEPELSQRIRADLERLDGELALEGVFAVAIGETADLGGGLTVRPIDVTEDSRCPQNVDCVWAGQLVLRADVSGAERDLILGEALETPHGTLTLAVVTPSPWQDWPAADIGAPPPYRFGFRKS